MNVICEVQQFPIGPMSGIFLTLKEEQQIMKKYQVDFEMDEERDVMDEFAKLNCVLDEHFEELTLKTPVPSPDSLSTLLSIINRRSPNLKGLFIFFLNSSYLLANLSPESLVIAQQDFHLRSLTSLSLEHDTSMMTPIIYETSFRGDINQYILSSVGKHCPALIKLNVSLGFTLEKEHLLELIFGEKVSVVTDDARWNRDSVLVGLQIPPEFLNPLCLTLEEFTLISRGGGISDWFDREPNAVDPTLTPFVYAFALRQLPKLRKMELDTSITDLFKIIYNVNKTGIEQQPQAEFEEHCRAVALQFGLEVDSITSPTPFTCKL
jgi:hypothetical protein